MVTLTDADAGDLAAVALAAALLALAPVEKLGTFIESFRHERARHRALFGTVPGVLSALARGVDEANRQAVDSQFPRCLVEQRLEHVGGLILAGAALTLECTFVDPA